MVLRVEGTVKMRLAVVRCVIGPVRVAGSGRVNNFTATDSIVQSLDGQAAIDLATADVSILVLHGRRRREVPADRGE